MSPPRVSPSQIDLFRKCPRKWAWAYIYGFREEDTTSTILGRQVHSVLEGYLRHGTRIDGTTKEGAIAQAGLPYLPEPGTGLVEPHFEIPWEDFVLHGYIDWTGEYLLDHKTTSDFKWAKTPETLATDSQAILYGWAGLGAAPERHLRWLYYRTKGAPKAKPVDTVLTRAHLGVGLAGLGEEASLLVALSRAKTDPLSLPANPQNCFAYNKLCHNAHRCNLTPLERIQRMQPIGKDALLASLKDKALGAVSVTAPSTPPPGLPGLPGLPAPAPLVVAPPPPPAPPPVPNNDAAIAALQAQLAALTAPPPAPVAPLPVAPPPAPVAPPPPVPAPEVRRGPGRPAGSGKEKGPIATLYVNCLPLGEKVSLANDLFTQAHAQVTAAGFAHYKHIEFGKGPSVFAACVAEAAKALKNADMYVDSKTPEGSDCLETLITLADCVVRGV